MARYSFLVAAGAILAAANYVGKKQEDLLNAYRGTQTERDKKRLTRVLRNFSFRAACSDALDSFGSLSDTLFGKSIFSWRALARSAMLSLCWFGFLCSLSLYLQITRTGLGWRVFRPDLVEVFLLLLFVCIAIDYLSICCTRGLIKLVIARSTSVKAFVFVIDFAFSATIFTLFFLPTKLAVSGVTTEELKVWLRKPGEFFLSEVAPWIHISELPVLLRLANDVRFVIGPNGAPVAAEPIQTTISYIYPESAAFFSSMLTSVWLWIYLAAWLATGATAKLDVLKNFAVLHANLRDDPVAVLSFWFQVGLNLFALILIAAIGVYWIFS